ncbi:hypothetical protein V8J82_05320 [Gymnodinialimonas sp. 2305UL16-5]
MTATDSPGLGIGPRILSGVLVAAMFVCVKPSARMCRWARSFSSGLPLP